MEILIAVLVLIGLVPIGLAALTAPRNTIREESDLLRIPMAADAVIYVGGLVCVDADGYAVPAADTANYKFVGVCIEDDDNPGVSTFINTGGSDGDISVVVRRSGRFRYNLALRTPSQDMMGAKVYVYDDQTVAVHKWDVTNDVQCGYITALPGWTLTMDPHADFASDEVEIQISGEPFDWGSDLTTTPAPTTTAGA